MNIKDAVVLVTGANRGLGHEFVKALQAGGAKKIYAAARDPASITVPGVHPLRLDVTNADDIAAAAKACPDLTLLINNAGIASGGTLLSPKAADVARKELETNFFGPLALTQAFAPTLKANGGGGIINVLSVVSWVSMPGSGTYCASKSAAWSLTNGLRSELKGQNTQVLAVHVGMMLTDMTKGMEGPKIQPEEAVRLTLEALERGDDEVLCDEVTRRVKQGLGAPRGVYLGAPRG